jgi:hypothetical protein
MYNPNQELVTCQSLIVLAATLVIGPWVTVSAYRVIQNPTRVREKSLVNWAIRVGAESHFLMRGNVRFWAWMAFLFGIWIDLMAIFALIVLVQIAFFPG